MAQPDWPARLTRVVAGEVRRFRQERKMSAQQLADRCAEIGMPIPRSVLANLENGRRDTVSVAEVLVLAWALGVPPIALLCPVGHAEFMEPLPAQPMLTQVALEWFTGEGTLLPARSTLVAGPPPEPTTSNVTLYRAYADAEREWVSTDQRVRQLVDQSDRGVAELYVARLTQIEDSLRSYLALIAERGLLLPYVRPELADLKPVDETRGGEQDGR